jgi:hypothetical protein
MGSKDAVAWFSLLLLALAAYLPATAVAHDASTFTIIVREQELTAGSPQLMFNDSVWWINVDDRENITHRIVYDSDGDGLYNGTLDWDSGNLSSSCSLDDNGTKIDSECEVTYEIPFNGTWGDGIYHYYDLVSDGTMLEGNISVVPDSHQAGGVPPENYEYNPDSEEEEETELDSQGETSDQNWLLWVAIASGLASVILLMMLLKSDDDSLREEETSDDSDISATAKEE